MFKVCVHLVLARVRARFVSQVAGAWDVGQRAWVLDVGLGM